MIKILDKKECCGCAACENICPLNCIKMKQDFEGFLYPVIDSTKCVKCNKCSQVCPIINHTTKEYEIRQAFVVQNRNTIVRYESSSGGFFSAIASYTLSKGGCVISAKFNGEMQVEHQVIHTEEELEKARGSKYVQSKIGKMYRQVKALLEEGENVCFAGTPCQIEGLYSFLGRAEDNLITVDVVCHGVPSPKVWEKYMNEAENKYKKRVVHVDFRDKSLSYNKSGMKLFFADGTKHFLTPPDIYLNTFFSEICSRPSCYDCKFKTKGRISDFTIFDAWHAFDTDYGLDKNGATNVFINTSKGEILFSEIMDSLIVKKIDAEEAIHTDGIMVLNSAEPNSNRKEFFDNLEKYSLSELQELYYPVDKIAKIKFICKDTLNKLGLLTKLIK